MKKRIAVMFALTSMLIGSANFVFAATHYVLGYSAVDSGEIRWDGSTSYSTQWNAGISTWNALGKINIAPDSVWTYQDVTVSDVNRSDGDWKTRVGLYTPSIGSDTIQFNKYNMNDDSKSQKQMATTHELGHALGLAHSYSGNIMVSGQTSQTSLGTQDKSDYGYLWRY